MFTGIVETLGTILSLNKKNTNISFTVESNISAELTIDQSVAHDGICLTVEAVDKNQHTVTAIQQTIDMTALQQWEIGKEVNLERCLPMNGRLDGHLVQGHVDATASCISVMDKAGSWEYRFRFDDKFCSLLIEKGSVTINGTSLTLFNLSLNEFSVAIIPYTYNHTNFKKLQVSELVNIEFDMIGKYINRIMAVQNTR